MMIIKEEKELKRREEEKINIISKLMRRMMKKPIK
jgi:hypothetical protein